MTRLFGEKNMAYFVRGMETENWNEIYISMVVITIQNLLQ